MVNIIIDVKKEIEYCCAIIEFSDKTHMSCELEEGHKEPHLALGLRWEGDGVTKGTDKEKDEHKQLFNSYINNILNEEH